MDEGGLEIYLTNLLENIFQEIFKDHNSLQKCCFFVINAYFSKFRLHLCTNTTAQLFFDVLNCVYFAHCTQIESIFIKLIGISKTISFALFEDLISGVN